MFVRIKYYCLACLAEKIRGEVATFLLESASVEILPVVIILYQLNQE